MSKAKRKNNKRRQRRRSATTVTPTKARRSTADRVDCRKSPSASGRRYWHYTTITKLQAIIESGEILPATGRVPDSETPAVWCSANRRWEETACKGTFDPDGTYRRVSRDEMRDRAGLARIEVRPDATPHNWREFKALSGVAPAMARRLTRNAKAVGSTPGDWRVSFAPIPASAWLSIETDTGNGWEPYDDDSWQVGTEAADHHATESNVATAAAMANDSPSGEFWAYSRPSESTEWSGVRIR